MTNTDTPCRPIIFVGPSVPSDLAKRILPYADYRPPIKRGDLDDIPPGAIVGIIDGVFAQTLAISPGEIREAIGRGVVVYGAASMGALRAAEVPSVVGVGRVFEMYSAGTIERDDEVALLFHPETYEPLTEPLVNVRYAVERLVRSATLSRNSGDALIEACSQLHFSERTYEAIFKRSKLAHNADVEDIIRLLRTFDLKRNDAQFLLEKMSQLEASTVVAPSVAGREAVNGVILPKNRAHDREDGDAPVMVWESGDCVDFSELLRFLKVVGTFEKFARDTLGRWAIAGAPLRTISHGSHDTGSAGATNAAQSLLDAARLQWGWDSPEEAHVTMRDLGLGLLDVSRSLEAEVIARRRVASFGKNSTDALKKALRCELWMKDLSLKRETLRFGALYHFAKRGAEAGPATESELTGAKRCICRLRMAIHWSAVKSELDALGVPQPDLDAMVRDLALARRAAWPIVQAMDLRFAPKAAEARAAHWAALGLGFESSVKPEDSNRFSLSLPAAARYAEEIAKQIGIVRIGLIGELDTLGVHVAQAFAGRSGWSASFSSGKAETRDGARVGSIMEEVEIHAQDAFKAPRHVRAPFIESCDKLPLINPRTLDLPYDSTYSDTLEIDWSEGIDLLNCRRVLVPTACLLGERVTNDIYYSPRLGGKIFSTSGLGSGFSLAEATVHAAAEYIERHAQRLAEFEIDNPGGVGIRQFWFVDHGSLPDTPRRIVEKYRRAGMCVRILDITSEVAVPTYYVRVFDDPFTTYPSATSDGFGCHPNPEVAVTMALLEAAQTRAGIIAGGREDYSLQARSLGRHERPRTMLPQSQAFWFGNDRPFRSFQDTLGFISRDIFEELEWIIGRVEEAGVSQFIVVDYTMARIRPAFAVRVIIPGLETTNPLFTGERARATSIRDLLPRRAPEAE